MKKNKDSIFSKKSDAGKGDQPRSISKKFWDNYDEIDWSANKKLDNSKKTSHNKKV